VQIVSYYPATTDPDTGVTTPQSTEQAWDSTANTYVHLARDGSTLESRPLTADEVARFTTLTGQMTGSANAAVVHSRAQAALTANAAFLALASPTNAQVVAQVQRLTKECNALIRLTLSLLADISDTA